MFFISRTNKANGGRMIEILNLIAISIFSSGIQKNINDLGMRLVFSFDTIIISVEQTRITVFH